MKPEENLAMSAVFTVVAGTVILCAGLPLIAFLVVAALIGAIIGALVVKVIPGQGRERILVVGKSTSLA